MKNIIIILIVLFGVISNLSAQTVITVTKTTDVDPFEHPYNFDDALCDPDMYGTLQWAIRKANDTGGDCVIVFNIVGTGQQEILLDYEFPMIRNNVIIDATTQFGYSFGAPSVKLNGQENIGTCFQTYNCEVKVYGFEISGFLFHGIIFNTGNNSEASNNVINSIENGTNTTAAIGLRTILCDNVDMYGNIIGTDANLVSGIGIENYGVFLQNSYNCIIGFTATNQFNVITNCGMRGILLSNSNNNKFSGNLIYNNPIAIYLGTSNQNKQPPVINSYSGGVLSGTSQANDIIEIFGSTGTENANEYLATVTTDASGNWTVIVSTTYNYFIATATDLMNNTSQLSMEYSTPALPGQNCETAIQEITKSEYIPTNYFVSDSEFWLKFDADTTVYTIIINDIDYNIDILEIFQGSCANLDILIAKYDSLTFILDNTTIGNTYYLKFSLIANSNIDICILKGELRATDPPEPIFNCASYCLSSTNLILDPSFENEALPPTLNFFNTTFNYDNIANMGHIGIMANAPGGCWSCAPYDGSRFLWCDQNNNGGINNFIWEHDNTPVNLGTTYCFSFWVNNLNLPLCSLGYDIADVRVNINGTDLVFDYSLGVGGINVFLPYVEIPRSPNNWIQICGIWQADDNIADIKIYHSDNQFMSQGNDIAFDLIEFKEVLTSPTANAGIDQTICVGGSATLTATGGGTYEWDTGGNTASITVYPIITTTYTVIVTDNQGCTASDDVIVTVDIPIASISANPNPGCVGQLFTVSTPFDNSYQYIWNTGDNTSSFTVTIYTPQSVTYEVTVTNTLTTCTNTDVFVFDVFDLPILPQVVITHPTCEDDNGSILIDNPNPNFTYYWSNFTSGNAINNIGEGTYSVTITDVITGCTNNDEYELINQTFIPILDCISTSPTCFGGNDGSVTVNVNTVPPSPPFTFSWNTGASTQTVDNLAAGTYTVDVTNDDGCISTCSATITNIYSMDYTINVTDESCDNCCNGIVEVIDNFGNIVTYTLDNPYILQPPGYITNSTGFFDQLCNGVYNLILTDDNGCTALEEVTVPTNNLIPEIIIEVVDDCYYVDEPVLFTATVIDPPTSGGDIIWDFGDLNNPAPGLGASVTHTYIDYGYYCITATYTSCCGTAISNSITIFVNPNICACDAQFGGMQTYDFTGINNITTNTTWDAGFPNGINVEGEIHVLQGQTLTIQGPFPGGIPFRVRFAPNAKIIVEQGGHLIIRSSVLTSIENDCAQYMWQGIEVWGNESEFSTHPDQGDVIMNNTMIEHAHIGVLLGARDMDAICNYDPNPTIPQNNWFNTTLSGGVIQMPVPANAFENIFRNNGIDIRFLLKHVNFMEAGENEIHFTKFLCSNEAPPYSFIPLTDDHYNSNLPNFYPNNQNPWAGVANNYQASYAGVMIENQTGFDIEDCEFRFHEFGIRSIQAQYDVFDNIFERVRFGIWKLNPGQNANFSQSIQRNYFNLIAGVTNPNFLGNGIFSIGGFNDRINHNEFENLGGNINGCQNAIFSLFSSNYTMLENEIDLYVTGIVATWSGTGIIGAGPPDWDGNQISRCRLGIETNSFNPSLLLKCNDHYPDAGDYINNWENYHSSFMWNILSLGNQGAMTMPNGPAGNTFNDIAIRDIESDWPYNYARNNGLIFTPVPNAQINVSPGAGPYPILDVDACSPPFPIIAPLPALSFSTYPYSILEMLNNSKDSLNSIKDNIIANLDNGETQILFDAIYGTTPQGQLKNMLIAHSPLSDTVLIALMTESALVPGLYKNVMEQNIPVDNYVYPLFDEYLQNLPSGIEMNLRQLLFYNPFAITPETIQGEINQLQMTYSNLFIRISNMLVDTNHNRLNDLVQLLEYDNSDESNQVLFSTYLVNGDYSAATAKLSNLPDNYINHDFVELQQIVLDLYMQDTTIYAIDSADYDYVWELANKCPANPGVFCARVIVEMITGQIIQTCPKGVENKSMTINSNTFNFIDDENFVEYESLLGKNYPDPFSNQTKIPYSLKDESSGTIIIKDMLGRTVSEFIVVPDNHVLTVNTEKWAEGVYIYTLFVGERIIGSEKMILAK